MIILYNYLRVHYLLLFRFFQICVGLPSGKGGGPVAVVKAACVESRG